MNRTFLKGAAVALALAALNAQPAAATDWWLLDLQGDRCMSAAEEPYGFMASPGAFADEVRIEGGTASVEVSRLASGEIIFATVTVKNTVMVWAATLPLCVDLQRRGERAGWLARPEDLE